MGLGDSKIEVRRTVCTPLLGAAAPWMPWWKTACGCARSRCSTRPINLGAHCAKGAPLREHGHGEYRLRYPMKLVNGKYQRISWDTGADRDLRQDAGSAQGQRP